MWNSVVTNVGITLLAQWGQGGTLTIDGAKAGTGAVPVAQLMAQTNVAGNVHDLSIVRSAEITNGVKYTVQLQASQSAYIAMQIGIWAHLDSGSSVLVAIYQAEEGNGISVPSILDMPDFAVQFFASVEQDNTGDYTTTIDTSALVTQGQMMEAIDEVKVSTYVADITSGQWSGSGSDWYITVSASNVTENSILVPNYDNASAEYLKGPVWCVPSNGSFSIHTSAIPSGTVKVMVQMLGVMGEAQYQVLADVYSKSQTYSKDQAVAKTDIINNLDSTETQKPGSANMLRMLNGYIPTWKRMSGTATVAAGGGNVDVGEFPPLVQNSRLVLGMSTSSSSVIPVGWVINSANKLNIIVRNISSASIEATLTCVAIYLPDAKAWT